MQKQDQAIRILIIEDALDEAEQIVSHLRNHGIAIRPHQIQSKEEITTLLSTQECHFVLANPNNRIADLEEIVNLVRKTNKDCPLLVSVAEINETLIMQWINYGIRRFILRSQPDHMLAVIRREWEDLLARRTARRLEAALKESERRCDALLESSRDPIAYIHEGMHVRANKAYLEMFGYMDFADVEGMPILDMIAQSSIEDFKNVLKELSKGESPPTRLDIKVCKAGGSAFDVVMEFAQATYENEPCQQITFRLNTGAAFNPDEDLITGLYSRAFFLRELDRVVSEAANGKDDLSVLLLEPDEFSRMVESLGLGSMDLLLADLAAVIRDLLHPDDIAARLSDSMFAILMRRCTHNKALERAQNIRRAFDERIFDLGGKSLSVTLSGGMIFVSEHIANANAILGHAAALLKTAQQTGSSLKHFDPEGEDKADVKVERERVVQIEKAIQDGAFTLFYQPIVSLHGAEGEFYEAHLRMKNTEAELLPAEFFPIAEKHGMLPALDRWIISNVIQRLSERKKEGHKTIVFLKITIPSIEDTETVTWIAQQLKTYRVSGDQLVFEMPESKITTNLKVVYEFLKNIRQLHCQFAVQQFGSGLNSFQLLKHIDVQYVKIDRIFMDEFSSNRENQEKVREICDQARAIGKPTIAEFVEDTASMSILFGFNISFVQGNFLQEPEQVMSYDFNM